MDKSPSLTGLEVLYPQFNPDDNSIEMEIEPGESHIVILRRFQGSCRYGLSYLTHARKLTHEELVEMAKNEPEVRPIGDGNAFYTIANTIHGCAFYF